MKGVWELFGLAGVGDKSIDSCHSGGIQLHDLVQPLDKAARLPSRRGIRCLKQSAGMLLHPSPFLLPGHLCSVINNTEKSMGSALGSKILNEFLQKTPWARVGCATPPPALPGVLTSLPAMSLETLGKFGISMQFSHHCFNRHLQITCSVCIFYAVWIIKRFAEMLREALPPRQILCRQKKSITSVMMW